MEIKCLSMSLKSLKTFLGYILKKLRFFSESRLFIYWLKCSKYIPYDKLYITIFYRLAMHKKLNWKAPKLYTEKIQILKLENRDPLFSNMVDKFQCRQIIANLLGEKYLIPILGVWDNVDEIDFSNLPEQFVLKATHDSGSVLICKNKSNFDIKLAKKKLQKALKTNYFYKSREYPYKNAIPRIIAEKYLFDETQEELIDYKFFCFNGIPVFLQITSNYNGIKNVVYYDMNFQVLPFTTGSPMSNPTIIRRPESFTTMKCIAEKLARGIKHIRIDLYYVNQQIYFGEFTFHNSGGIIHFNPPEWDKKIGDLLKI